MGREGELLKRELMDREQGKEDKQSEVKIGNKY